MSKPAMYPNANTYSHVKNSPSCFLLCTCCNHSYKAQFPCPIVSWSLRFLVNYIMMALMKEGKGAQPKAGRYKEAVGSMAELF